MVQVFEHINPASSPHCGRRPITSITLDIDPTTIVRTQHGKASVPKSSSSGNKLVTVPAPQALVKGKTHFENCLIGYFLAANASFYLVKGIYVGEGFVIHLTRTGVDKTSLECFQQEGKNLYSLHLYAYGQPQFRYWLTRWGTCTTLPETKSPQEVMNKARELHERDSFGKYDLIYNNCEHFALFCRTGIRASAQTALVSACGQKINEVKEWIMKFLQTK